LVEVDAPGEASARLCCRSASCRNPGSIDASCQSIAQDQVLIDMKHQSLEVHIWEERIEERLPHLAGVDVAVWMCRLNLEHVRIHTTPGKLRLVSLPLTFAMLQSRRKARSSRSSLFQVVTIVFALQKQQCGHFESQSTQITSTREAEHCSGKTAVSSETSTTQNSTERF